MWAIIFAIVAVIAGYFLYKKYETIDVFLFAKGNPDYVPFGKSYLLVSAVIGGIYALVSVILSETGGGNVNVVSIVAGVVFLVIYGLMVWQIVKNIVDVKTRVWKSLFALVCVAVSAIIGVLAMMLIIMAVVLFLLWKIIDIFFLGGSSSGKRVKLRKENGEEVEGTKGFGGDVYGDDGKTYEQADDLIESMLGSKGNYREKN